MTIGEQILRLSVEYTDSVAARDAAFYGGNPVGREPSEIAADYEKAIFELVRTS
jgi:hypothetical protein